MTSVTGPGKLDLGRIVSEAFALPWRRRGEFARALAIPALAIVAIRLGGWLAAEKMTGAIAWAAWGANGVLWILFAVACHRLVLLDRGGADIPVVPGWGRRETVFLLWLVFISVTTFVAGSLMVITVGTVAVNLFSVAFFETFVQQSMYLLGTYLFARLALLLPAAAIDVRSTFDRAWRQTRGNGWRMVVVVGVLPWTFAYLADFIEGDKPGVAVAVFMTVVATVLLAVEISALSLSYRQLADADTAITGTAGTA
jgi:hypothetical protein